MKKVLLLLVLLPFMMKAQDIKLPIRFIAEMKSEYDMFDGKTDMKDMDSKKEITFDGKTIVIKNSDGSFYDKETVLKYRRMEDKKLDVLSKVTYRIKVLEKDMDIYYILTYTINPTYNVFTLMVPIVFSDGMVASYENYTHLEDTLK